MFTMYTVFEKNAFLRGLSKKKVKWYLCWRTRYLECLHTLLLPTQCKKSFNIAGMKNRVFRRSNASCKLTGWIAHLYEPPTQKLKTLQYGKVCDADDGDYTASEVMYPWVSLVEDWCDCAKESWKRTNNGAQKANSVVRVCTV